MCGICGVAGRDDEQLVRTMSDAIAHRGPDGSGVKAFAARDGRAPATLGHRRLSIIDPSTRGAQPMATPDGRYWITYNGELYNFRALRRELENEGVRFRSDCDTEVLLALYARDGATMLGRLDGIFAFGVWDAQQGELFLARDRLGVKPLYYAEHDGATWFGSEVKALLPALPPVSLRPSAVADFLTFLWVPDPDTMFEGVRVLPAGHCARWRDGRLEMSEYWDMRFPVDARPEREWVEATRESVATAVRRQTVADVPLGSFLSGGLDSGAIVAELARSIGRVTTYTVGFNPRDLAHEIVPDDVQYARDLAARFDVDYHERTLEPDIVELLSRLVWHMDDPVADPAAISTYLICAAARERLTVILSGMGGDEIFAGYPRHLAAAIGRFADRIPGRVRSSVRRAAEGRLTLGRPGRLRGPRRNAMKLLRGIDADPDTRYLVYCSYYRPEELRKVLSSELRASLGEHDPFRHHRAYLDRVRGEHWLNRLLYLDLKTFLPNLNLAYTDKMSMAASTEVRVPLLANDLVDLSGRIPPDLKLHRTRRKYVLKRSQEGILPNDVIWRPKAGFGAPVRSWLVGELRPMVQDVLSPERVAARGLLDPDEVQRLIAAGDEGTEDNALRVWALLTLELWQQQFLDGSGRPSPAPSGRR
jgi:asparagine synthase (glutamine-hydrolysing)